MILTTRAVTTEYLEAELTTTYTTTTTGGGLGGGGGDIVVGGGDWIRYHALGGPSVDDEPSKRAYDANHVDAS